MRGVLREEYLSEKYLYLERESAVRIPSPKIHNLDKYLDGEVDKFSARGCAFPPSTGITSRCPGGSGDNHGSLSFDLDDSHGS